MSETTSVFILFDDNDPGFGYGGGTWVFDDDPHWVNGETLFPGFANATARGTISFTFEGVSIAFHGNTPNAGDDQTFQVIIDGNKEYTTSTSDPSPQSYRQWYQSPLLESGPHQIQLAGLDGTALDYATVIPGPDTSLSGRTLMIDDSHPDISYSGSWTQNTDMYVGGENWCNGTSFQNGTHRTSTAGDSMTFVYTGTNVSLYGLFHWSTVGSMILSYAIDDGPSSQASFSSNNEKNYTDEPNFHLLSSGELAAGKHTLTVNLTEIHDQTLIIDYILYEPSFSSLATQPNLTATSSTNIPSSSTTSFASSGTVSSATAPFSPSASSSSSGAIVAAKSHRNTGAIAGGVVGGIAALSVLLILLFCLTRRKPRPTAVTELNEILTPKLPLSTSYTTEPYLMPGAAFVGAPPSMTPSMKMSNEPSSFFSSGTSSDGRSILSGSDITVTSARELRARIDLLEQENRRLATFAPPAYGMPV